MRIRPSFPALIVSILLCVAVFLPWITADVMGISVSANGTDTYPGIITLVMAILAVLCSIFANQKAGAVGIVIAGLAAAGGIVGYWFLEYADIQNAGLGGLVSVMPGYGLYIAGGLILILIICGFTAMGRPKEPAAYAPPYQAPQQTYQAPPQSYQAPPQNYNAPPPPPPGGSGAPPPPPPPAPR
jgi:hypothetical protein